MAATCAVVTVRRGNSPQFLTNFGSFRYPTGVVVDRSTMLRDRYGNDSPQPERKSHKGTVRSLRIVFMVSLFLNVPGGGVWCPPDNDEAQGIDGGAVGADSGIVAAERAEQ